MAKTLGNEIQRVRQLRGLSLNATAQPAGVSAAYLQKLERDQVESPSPHRLQRLAEVLGVEYADLFSLAGYPFPQPSSEGTAEAVASESQRAASALRRMLSSEEEVSDAELEELVRYLKFMREQRDSE